MDIPSFEKSLALLNLHGSTAESDGNKWFDFDHIELGLEIYTDCDHSTMDQYFTKETTCINYFDIELSQFIIHYY